MEFIAEIGLNHNGNFNLAYELVRQAKYAGADTVKFQLGWRGKEGELNYIDENVLLDLKKFCEHFEIELLFSVFTNDAFELIQKINPRRYKIASRTLKGEPELVKRIVGENKPVIVSLGMWDEEKLPFEPSEHIQYLWCKSKYPTHPWDLKDLPKKFEANNCIGYSDHAVGIDTALLAIARGAKVIEKHFTLDKSDVTIRDHALSATPDEFRLLTQIGREMAKKIEMGV